MTAPINEQEEMYLKTLYEFYSSDPQTPIRNSRLAEAMGVSAAATSEMVQRLAGKGVLYHIPYRGATLTQDGLAAAAQIKRREGLMEVFLAKMIDYKGDIKAAACRLEHALNDELEAAIDRMLGYPERTPSGDMIPQVDRHVEAVNESMLIPLRSLPEGMGGMIELIVLQGQEFRSLEVLGLEVGALIRATEEGYRIGEDHLILGDELLSRILVRTMKD